MGGVLYSHMDSLGSFINCSFKGNIAEKGGVAFLNDDGYSSFESCVFVNNFAMQGNIMYLINIFKATTFSSSYFENENLNDLNFDQLLLKWTNLDSAF